MEMISNIADREAPQALIEVFFGVATTTRHLNEYSNEGEEHLR